MNPYQAQAFKIIKIGKEGSNSKLFTIQAPRRFRFQAGQFVMVGIPGFGEAPISICSEPRVNLKTFQIGVRVVGLLTSRLHKLKAGDRIYIRGPYGRGFPTELAKKRNLLLVAGGLGLMPLRPVILDICAKRKQCQKVQLFYGAKTMDDLLYRREYASWMKKGIDLNVCLEKPSGKFKLKCPLLQGVITILFEKVRLEESPIAFLCGPPIMYKFVIQKLKEQGFKDKNIFLSLERRMDCGVGICQHCAVGSYYTCKDGPVFSLKELNEIKGAYQVI